MTIRTCLHDPQKRPCNEVPDEICDSYQGCRSRPQTLTEHARNKLRHIKARLGTS